ncbi:MAG: MIP family channel protein, partial [Cyanobacteria bacterium J06635_13]
YKFMNSRRLDYKALIAEFIGTFALIFIGVSTIAASEIGGGSAGLVGIALGHGLTIAVMVSATAAISGGHLNPAVTFGAWLARKINSRNALGYILAQCLAALLAASLVSLTVPHAVLSKIAMGTPAPGTGVPVTMALMMEIVLTFFLVFVVFGTAIDGRAPKMGGLFVGLTVTFDILAGGPISGAAMNPARYLGPALVSGNLEFFWLYWIGPLAGGAIAGLLYYHVLQESAHLYFFERNFESRHPETGRNSRR